MKQEILTSCQAEVTISSPPDGPRSAEPGVALLLWRWPLEEEANKGKTANEARRNETETGHEANKGNDRQATKHDDTKQKGTRHETKAAAPTAKPQGEGGEGEGKGEGRWEGGVTGRSRKR